MKSEWFSIRERMKRSIHCLRKRLNEYLPTALAAAVHEQTAKFPTRRWFTDVYVVRPQVGNRPSY
jgi:hypothetical protein